jgi:homoserine kinase
MQQITVRVPASSSNLGPGFDCLGVALRIYNTLTVAAGGSRHPHPQIVSEAATRFFKQARRRAFSFSYSIAEQIPRSRGLGSSAAVRIGVLLALNRLSGDPLDRSRIFELGGELEGHPDNVAPATFGGFTVVRNDRFPAVMSRRLPKPSLLGSTVQHFSVSPRLHFVLFIPEIEVRTSVARKILPSKILRAAAVDNCAKACALTAAFVSRDYEQLRGVFRDQLHQPFRTRLIPFLPRLVAAAEEAGALGAFLSGSGSTIAAVTLRAPQKIAAAMAQAANTPGRTIITHADNRGARISNLKSEIT